MKELFILTIFLIFFTNCSFDNKTGLWKELNQDTVKKQDIFKEFKNYSSIKTRFNKEIKLSEDIEFIISNPVNNLNWKDFNYSKSNNLDNFSFQNLGTKTKKSKKISRYSMNKNFLLENDNIILNDVKGNIIIFSLKENKIISKFNFYRKKYKKINKYLNLAIENNSIYVSDNFGYLYAYDYVSGKILWAKNYKIPFRSNLKIFNDKIILANQDNTLFILNKNDGNLIKLIPTEETIIKNQFINNISVGIDDIFFLNSYGTLYSIDTISMKTNWFNNLNQALDINTGNIFEGNLIVNNKKKIIISTNFNTYLIDTDTGVIKKKFSFSSNLHPIINNNIVFLITKNNYLISLNIENNKVLYSYNIKDKIQKSLRGPKKNISIQNFFLSDNQLLIFLNNSKILTFNVDGNFKSLSSLSSKINSTPIFISDQLMYLNNRNKLIQEN